MNVVYACDDSYAPIAAVSMQSLLESNREVPRLKIYVVDDAVSSENRKKLALQADSFGREIEFLPFPEQHYQSLKMSERWRWTRSTMVRLMLPSLLKGCSRVLYLDCDTLVLQDLSALWEVGLPQWAEAAAVAECMGDRHKKAIGLMRNDIYFNTGVLLLGLKRLRKSRAEEDFADYFGGSGGRLPYPDQSVINHVLCGRISLLPPEYNAQTVWYDLDYSSLLRYRKTEYVYTEPELAFAMKSPAILHFTSSFMSRRPWVDAPMSHPFATHWRSVKSRSAFSGSPLWEDRRSFAYRWYERLFRALPKTAAVELSGFLHSDLKPVFTRLGA